MDELLKQLEQISLDLIHNLKFTSLEEVEQFMERREAIFTKLQPFEVLPVDKYKYKDIVNRILSYDPIIVARMQQLKQEAEKELNKFTSGRLQKSAYDGEHQTADGIFFDQKK
jgi:hypothetical protein